MFDSHPVHELTSTTTNNNNSRELGVRVPGDLGVYIYHYHRELGVRVSTQQYVLYSDKDNSFQFLGEGKIFPLGAARARPSPTWSVRESGRNYEAV
jgi:hypothetical protein